MKASLILILFLTITAYGQHRNSTIDAVLPAPGSTGTVTLSLAEYDRLVDLASRKPKTADAAPLPFVLTRASFKLKLVNQTLVGTVEIDGSLLQEGKDRKSTRLNSSHSQISYAVFCLKKKKNKYKLNQNSIILNIHTTFHNRSSNYITSILHAFTPLSTLNITVPNLLFKSVMYTSTCA